MNLNNQPPPTNQYSQLKHWKHACSTNNHDISGASYCQSKRILTYQQVQFKFWANNHRHLRKTMLLTSATASFCCDETYTILSPAKYWTMKQARYIHWFGHCVFTALFSCTNWSVSGWCGQIMHYPLGTKCAVKTCDSEHVAHIPPFQNHWTGCPICNAMILVKQSARKNGERVAVAVRLFHIFIFRHIVCSNMRVA